MEYLSSTDIVLSYRWEIIALLLFSCMILVAFIYRKKIQRKKVFWRVVKIWFVTFAVWLLLVVVVAIEYNYDFWPESDDGQLLSAKIDVSLSPREVTFSSLCRLECSRYFRFDATRVEIDQIVEKMWLQRSSYGCSSSHLIWFRPWDDVQYHYRNDYGVSLCYDEEDDIAYMEFH